MAQQYTKKMIQQVFVKMLNEHPLHKITVKDLSERCEINRNTFYYHYTDIYSVLDELFESELAKVIEEFNESLSWEESFMTAATFALDNRRAINHIYHSMRREELSDYIYKVSENVMSGYIKRVNQDIRAKESDVRLINLFYQSALTDMVLRWIAGGMKEDPESMIYRIGELFDGNIETSLKRSR